MLLICLHLLRTLDKETRRKPNRPIIFTHLLILHRLKAVVTQRDNISARTPMLKFSDRDFNMGEMMVIQQVHTVWVRLVKLVF